MHRDSNADQLAFEVNGTPTPNGSSTPSVSTVTEPSTPPSSSASALDSLLNEYRARATSERAKGTLYDRFFSQALPRMSERLGIVFTPVEVVDFIIRSADDAMRTAFGQSLGDPGVAIIETKTSKMIKAA